MPIYVIYVTMCAMFILLGYEIRYRNIREELENLNELLNFLQEDVKELKAKICVN